MTINDNHVVVLVEMPVDIIPPNLGRFFWSVQSRGIGIVLAHPERNLYLMKNPPFCLNGLRGASWSRSPPPPWKAAWGNASAMPP